MQAIEFGCCPDQLFVKAHPRRGDDGSNLDFISIDIGRASSEADDCVRETWELLDAPTDDSPSREDHPSRITEQQEKIRAPEGNTGASSNARVSIKQRSTASVLERIATAASSDNATYESPKSYQVKSNVANQVTSTDWNMEVIERKHLHNDAVSGCKLLRNDDGAFIVTTSLDGGLQAHRLDSVCFDEDDRSSKGFPATIGRIAYSTIMSRGAVVSAPSKIKEFRSHSGRDPLACLALASDGAAGTVAFAGGHDDVVLAYGINSACAVASVYSHRDAVTGLDLIARHPLETDSAIWPENSTHLMLSGSWDAVVKVWSVCVSKSEAVSISREPLAELFDAEASIVCVSAMAIPGANGGIVIAAGCTDSSFVAWKVHSDGVQVTMHNEPARHLGSGPCTVVQWICVDGTLHLLVAFATGKVSSYSMSGERLKRDSAVSVGVAVTALAYCEQQRVLLLGCEDGGLRLLLVRDGAHFDTRPTLWMEVNHKSSPGISSMSVVELEGSGGPKCVCGTGGVDGSVALFHLRKGSD